MVLGLGLRLLSPTELIFTTEHSMTFAVVYLTIVFAQDIQRRLDHGHVTDMKGTVIQEISVAQNFSVYECLKLASFENSSGVGF